MSMALNAQVALVTGAASGISRATALALAQAGAAVAVLDRNAAGIASLVEEITGQGGHAMAITLDLSETSGCAPAVEAVVEKFGRLDILVNGAGLDVGQRPLMEITEEAWDLSHTVNLKAPLFFMQAAAKHMVAQGYGRIVNITSGSAHRAGKAVAPYATAKAALAQLTRNAAAELGTHGITVNAVAPGPTVTPIALNHFKTREAMIEAAKPGGSLAGLLEIVAEPEDVAATILFLCLPSSRQITAQTLHTSGGSVV